MKIIIDAMGGDNAPLEIVRGVLNAAKARPGLELVLVGREERSALRRSSAVACRRGCPWSTPRRSSTCTTTPPPPSR